MSRIIKASITINFDIDELEEFFGREFDDDEAEQYAIETFTEDMYSLMKHNEISEVVRLELSNG